MLSFFCFVQLLLFVKRSLPLLTFDFDFPVILYLSSFFLSTVVSFNRLFMYLRSINYSVNYYIDYVLMATVTKDSRLLGLVLSSNFSSERWGVSSVFIDGR